MEHGSSLIDSARATGFDNIGMLLLSLGITIALVGALFYYVRQRFEVLEMSHKEQIGVMQNFITSIGDQFHRMRTFIQQQLCDTGGEGEPAAAAEVVASPIAIKGGATRIDVSDDDEDKDADDTGSDYSEYDDSATSDTDPAEFGGVIKIHDIYLGGSGADDDHNANHDYDDDYGDGNTMNMNKRADRTSDIKIIELTIDSRHHTVSDDDDDDDDDEDEESDGESNINETGNSFTNPSERVQVD